ncbi:isoprenyl synthetase [Tenuifilaceae bacterium CYCD]|nr:isoprenyl synthetase [Tenuifilaceae bacterium CYCD]
MKKLKNNTDMYTFHELNDLVASTFVNLKFSKEPISLYSPVEYILGIGGKRIRPILTLAGCNVFSDSIEKAQSPSVAVEIFHNFTLVHDDIMDNADIRRGQPTIHKRWDNNSAILSGDAMTILAYQFLTNVDYKYLSRVLHIFNSFALGICEGQQYDMDFEKRSDVTRNEYLKMIELKTAVLLKGALQIGAVIGDAKDSDIERIGEFGRCLGVAFQLQDDLLDTYGNVETFGKKIGGDIVANKKTILTIETMNLLKSSDKEEFINLMSDYKLEKTAKIDAVIKIYDRVKVKELVNVLIKNYFDSAMTSLNSISVSSERKVVLYEIAEKLMNRNS